MRKRATEFVNHLATLLDRISWFDLVTLLTMIALIRVSHQPFYLALALGSAGLFVAIPKLRRQPWLWLSIVAFWIPRLIFNWQENEDHVYLVVYWCAALGLALWGVSARRVLATSARLLIGLSFAFAVAWKLISPQFHDGSLFHYKLLFDYRFREAITAPIGGLSSKEASQNVTSLRSLRAMETLPEPQSLEIPLRVTWVAVGMTAWTIIFEGLLAFLFLLPSKYVRSWIRDGALLFFLFTTYVVVPVMGFACLFAAMGVSQTPPDSKRSRLAYVGVLISLSAIYSMRWLMPSPG